MVTEIPPGETQGVYFHEGVSSHNVTPAPLPASATGSLGGVRKERVPVWTTELSTPVTAATFVLAARN